ncbi:phage portal protein [Paracoccus sp. IB05]|nr:phage portal protein [Paracoccus sp. IB05]
MELHRRDPGAVSIEYDDFGEPYYRVQSKNGGDAVLARGNLLHIQGLRGVSPVMLAREAIALALAAGGLLSGFFRNGGRPSGVILRGCGKAGRSYRPPENGSDDVDDDCQPAGRGEGVRLHRAVRIRAGRQRDLKAPGIARDLLRPVRAIDDPPGPDIIPGRSVAQRLAVAPTALHPLAKALCRNRRIQGEVIVSRQLAAQARLTIRADSSRAR